MEGNERSIVKTGHVSWLFMYRAGLPATALNARTGLTTTAPAPIFTPSPISMGPRICVPGPTRVPRPIVGCRLPVCLPVPPSVTSDIRATSFSTKVVSPMTMPPPGPRTSLCPSSAAGWLSMPATSDIRLCRCNADRCRAFPHKLWDSR